VEPQENLYRQRGKGAHTFGLFRQNFKLAILNMFKYLKGLMLKRIKAEYENFHSHQIKIASKHIKIILKTTRNFD
jgi:hypothetical protein